MFCKFIFNVLLSRFIFKFHFQPTVHFGQLLKWVAVTILHFARTVFGDFLETVFDSEYNNYKEKPDAGEVDLRKISEISDTELIMK